MNTPALPIENPETLRLLLAAICAHAILLKADTEGESHANIAREALGLADALIIQSKA